MSNNNIKTCPRCHQSFECKSDDIKNCHCASVELQQHHQEKISQQYDGCLCAGCLEQLSVEKGINS